MPTLHRDSHFVLERYAAPAFVRLARTAQPLTAPEQPARSLLACGGALAALDPATTGLLIDWRLSPRSLACDALEQAAAREAEAFAARFSRAAALLLTAAEPAWANASLQVFRDEEAAIAYVSVK